MAANHIPVAAVARRVTFFQPADKDAFAEKPNSAVAVNNINVTPQRVRIVVISVSSLLFQVELVENISFDRPEINQRFCFGNSALSR